jgi:hypothetical protein
MSSSDVALLIKKILIGIIITLIPFLILFGGLWFTQSLLSDDKNVELTQQEQSAP